MKVAIVCPYAIDRPGGVQHQAIQLVNWLRDAGHEAWLAAPGHSGGPDGTVYLGASIEVRGNGGVAPISAKPTVRRRLTRALARAEVVHIHEPLIPMASLTALRADTAPKVGTFHAEAGRFVSSVYWIGRPFLRLWASRLAVATAVSPVAAAAVHDLVSDLRIVPNAIDVNSYPMPQARNTRRVIFVGRDDERKGLNVLLEAWPSIRWHIPGAELLVVGCSRPPQPGVRFLGTVSEQQKRRYLASAALLVAPNLYGESFGIVLLEGMAAGCAVIASALPAFEYVLAGTGMLVPPGESATLAVAVTRLLLDDELRERQVAAQRERVRQFDRRVVLEQYLEAYETALALAERRPEKEPARTL